MPVELGPAAALLSAHTLRFGSFRATPYGLCAAAGLLAAMALSARMGKFAGLVSDAVWDTGLFAVASCFVTSRLLLVAHDPLAFRRYPLLVLGLPSLTLGGMAVAALVVVYYLWRKRIPLLAAMDAFAPGGALLALFLQLGDGLMGQTQGMPTTLPWGVNVGRAGVRVHPVTAYGMAGSLLLTGLLCFWLRGGHRQGEIAGAGLTLGGLAAFLLAMLTQPDPALGWYWLEPGQWIAIGAMCAGAVLWVLALHQPGTSGAAALPATVPQPTEMR